ncbi:hypothetical protein O181_091996 [Austropuccinia psidii MF-1]|uniref:Uncharacterized protein n=1 Tax=Austropuccinia psidii MF-1 TaxID=1389203 RepID=A0A9Q3IYH8_9BASI|nr:hypothetical protein [Austropuccinia psidii MF-1]
MHTILAVNLVGPNFGHGPIVQPWPLATTRGHQISSVCPSLQPQGISSFPSYHRYSRLQAWCIYGIIYHYAPFFLSNPIVTFSGPNNAFPNQGLKSQRPFQRRSNQLISLTSYGGNQKTLHGSQPPVSAEVGLAQFIQDYSKAFLKRYCIISISCQGIKYSILLGQLNSSVQASFNQPVWSWPNWVIPYSTVKIPSHSSNFKMARTVFPDLDNTVN